MIKSSTAESYKLEYLPEGPYYPNGMVTSPHYLASTAGLDILRRGGNALEACIAMGATLAVVFPHMCSLGGDAFWLFYSAKTNQIKALNASGRSAKLANLAFYQDQGLSEIPTRGVLSCNTVPGLLHGFGEILNFSHNSLGSTFSLESLLESAILYAEEGFAVSPALAKWSTLYLKRHKEDPQNNPLTEELAKIFFQSGSPLKHGEILRQRDLGRSLRLLAKEGPSSFYAGALGEKITTELSEAGSPLRFSDFKSHSSDWVEPLSVNYRGFTAYNLPPNTQGLASLAILNILQNFDLKSLKEGSSDYYHLLIEATKEAFSDRDQYLSDPAWMKVKVEDLISLKHGEEQAARINLKASKTYTKLNPGGDTVFVGAVDRYGNSVSMIQSIFYDFGSAVVAKDTGIILQNRGCYFSLDPKKVNVLAPKKRTLHTLNPAMLFKDKRPYLVYGTMGGEGQPQTQAQLITRIVDFELNCSEAISRPRFLYGRAWGQANNHLFLEGRISKEVFLELKQRGHDPVLVEDYS
ncbi:MAG: gamma-glutamyltransferase, partial [Desulfovibrionaceae bacterium]|nr:gamma-glutamyltransferase [Desulfovibrionaceae bacterium]